MYRYVKHIVPLRFEKDGQGKSHRQEYTHSDLLNAVYAGRAPPPPPTPNQLMTLFLSTKGKSERAATGQIAAKTTEKS